MIKKSNNEPSSNQTIVYDSVQILNNSPSLKKCKSFKASDIDIDKDVMFIDNKQLDRSLSNGSSIENRVTHRNITFTDLRYSYLKR